MNRPNLGKLDPATYRAMLTLSETADASAIAAGVEPFTIELVKIRTSQINGCAFCLRMHTRDALMKGETADRLAVIPAFRESQYFSPAEQAALVVAEAVARLGEGPLDEAALDVPVDVLDARQVAAVAWVAVVMNAWNRVAVTSGYPVAPAAA